MCNNNSSSCCSSLLHKLTNEEIILADSLLLLVILFQQDEGSYYRRDISCNFVFTTLFDHSLGLCMKLSAAICESFELATFVIVYSLRSTPFRLSPSTLFLLPFVCVGTWRLISHFNKTTQRSANSNQMHKNL